MSSYPKLYTLGHRAIANIFLDDVEVEEKVDGSQFTWGNLQGELCCFSKRCKIYLDNVPAIFKPSVASAQRQFDADLLPEGYLFRGEAVCAPKHNTLCYDRAPKGNIALFDVMLGPETYVEHGAKEKWADLLGIEVVPLIYKGKIMSSADLEPLLDRISFLGAQKIEGIVFKNYGRFGIDGKPLFGKYVSEAFKEVHNTEWKKTAPGKKDIIEQLVSSYCTPARWNKAVQHLRDAGLLTDSPKDIGALMKDCSFDVHEECAEEIKERLFKWAWPLISRGITMGIPQWYKDELAKQQFGEVG